MLLDDEFTPRPTPSAELPDPVPLLEGLARGVLEAIAGVRDVDQLARWFTADAYLAVSARVALSTRARSARAVAPVRPVFRILATRCTEPADGVVEAVVVVETVSRTRAIAIRLEGLDRRWRATSLAVL